MEPPKILIDNRQKEKVQTQPLLEKTEQILSALGCSDCEASIVITDDKEMEDLNKTFRGISSPTNVLAFPMQEGQFGDISPGLLGDVVISADTAEKEAQEAGITLDERMSQLLIHGILHLKGFDHEQGSENAMAMEKKSLELLRLLENNPNLEAF